MERKHATCITLNGKGVLITGPSGCGKSDLALRLIERGALLIADDQIELNVEKNEVIARAPAAIKGLIEARYIGLLKVTSQESAPIALILQPGTPERLPDLQTQNLLGVSLPLLVLPYLEGSTTAKIKLFLEQASN